jgi:mannan endo-1,4-beta-mannosidase
MKRRIGIWAAVATVLAGLVAAGAPASASSAPFVTRSGAQLQLGGHDYRFAGTNDYYLFYQSQAMVDDVFARAQVAKFTVLRTWGWSDTGSLDGTGNVVSPPNGVYFQYWNGTAPAYNDGATGLAHLDYEIWKAGQDGIKLIIPFTNNWSDFGGMDQYVRWAGDSHHDDFYTDPTIRTWFENYISHLLNHVNPLTGLAYKNDPTIMAWELANEPRCVGSGLYPASAACTTSTLTGWAGAVSAYVKTVDRHHLVGVGDEGYYCTDPGGADNTDNCTSGDDTLAMTALPKIDYMSYHLYPDSWSETTGWGTQWIVRHDLDARRLGKPAILGEFGSLDKSTRNSVYQQWTTAFALSGGTGFAYWLLSGKQDDGSWYPDYDGYTVYCPTAVCQTITNAGQELTAGTWYFAPVADDDAVTTPFATPVTLTPAANDIAYAGPVRAGTIDLDPATAGQQKTLTVTGGTFTVNSDGSVGFTPASGFHGKAIATYTVKDLLGTVSNTATITVTVKPDPTAAIVFASFESADLDGWAPASWQTGAGTLSQESTFATDGTSGLQVASDGGGWFGTYLATPVDISGKTALKVDLQTSAAAGTSVDIAVQNGSGYTWCQGSFSWVPAGTASTTYVADLTSGFSCDVSTLTDIRAIWVYLSAGQTTNLDYVRTD